MIRASLAVGALLLLGATCWLVNYSMGTPIADYRPDYQVESLTLDSLSRIGTEIQHPMVTLGLSWSTVDSPTFGQGPYKFRVWVRPNQDQSVEVLFDSITVASDRADYSFSPTESWPARPSDTTPYWSDIVFEPAFPFDHEGGEVVTTRIWYRIESGDQSTREYSEVRWVPVSYRKFFPIV